MQINPLGSSRRAQSPRSRVAAISMQLLLRLAADIIQTEP
jgi:hypothetical protein